MQGGYKWKIDGVKIYASNLTPDKETGIGNYKKLEFRDAVREGISQSGKKLHYPMPHYKSLTDDQVDAIFAYLQTLKPVYKRIKTNK